MRLISQGQYLGMGAGPLADSARIEFDVDGVDATQVYLMLHQDGDHIGTFYLSPDDAKLLGRSLKMEAKRAKQTA